MRNPVHQHQILPISMISGLNQSNNVWHIPSFLPFNSKRIQKFYTKFFFCPNVFIAVSSDPISEDSEPEDADYEADEGEGDEYEEDDDDTTTEKFNVTKTKSKSSRMEVQLPPRFEMKSSDKITKVESTTSTITSTQATPIISQAKTTKSIRLPVVRSEIVPSGFRGKIDDKRPKNNLTSDKNQLTNHETKVDVKPDSYVTVTKSVSGSLDSAKTTPTDNKQFESTYYTKSSTCGYFTFSCNIVYGSNGRSKICRPKTPANGKC